MEMTPGQNRAFAFILWKKPESVDDWITNEEWKQIAPQLDYGTSKDILKMFDSENFDMAIKQLKHFL